MISGAINRKHREILNLIVRGALDRGRKSGSRNPGVHYDDERDQIK